MKEKKKVQTENQERIKTPFSEMVRKFKKQKNAVVALCFIIFLIFLAFFGSKIVPYGINEYDYNAILQGPSMKHLFGTDEFGRDLFSRIICGTRISLAVGFGAVTVGAVCGTILGLLAGYYGGWIDSIIMRICDVLFAFPGLILAIAIVAILGSGMTNVVIAVAVFSTYKFETSDIKDEWWKEFGDENLNALVASALEKNTDLRTACPKQNADPEKFRFCPGGTEHRCFRCENSVSPHSAGSHSGHHCTVFHVVWIFHSDGIEPFLPGNGSTAADTGMGTASFQRKKLYGKCNVCDDFPGSCDFPYRTEL